MAHVLHKQEVGVILWVGIRKTLIGCHYELRIHYLIWFKSGRVWHPADAYKKMDDGKLCWDI